MPKTQNSNTLILKFGGAALQEIEHFSQVAEIILARKREYEHLIIVVSAMGRTTDELIALAHKVSEKPPERELDMLVSVGERISMALLAMALESRGSQALSFTGSQAGIITTSRHTDAKIITVKPHRLKLALESGKIIIVAGFQGVSEQGEITTLGRGGSDTTAVALGVVFGAHSVEFYKDVQGIFESDPKVHPEAPLLTRLNYDQALKVIATGERKIIHPRAVALAAKNSLPLHVFSFKTKECGSVIVGDDDPSNNRNELVYEEAGAL